MLTESLATIGESPSKKLMPLRVHGCLRVVGGVEFGHLMALLCQTTTPLLDPEEIGGASTARLTVEEMKRLKPVEGWVTGMYEHRGQHGQIALTLPSIRRILVHAPGLLACVARMRTQCWIIRRFTSPLWLMPSGNHLQILPLGRTAGSICRLPSMKWMLGCLGRMIHDQRPRESVSACQRRMIGQSAESSSRKGLCQSLDHPPVAVCLGPVVISLLFLGNLRPSP
mmetsp:Transcript_13975/g.33866  ORF Transcript_13975/g.33866 Transcript_13975/m.33866 type:complete len:226 (+) Transcript_13975:409-1086(+)